MKTELESLCPATAPFPLHDEETTEGKDERRSASVAAPRESPAARPDSRNERIGVEKC